jgi:hypothetical protein
MRFSRLVFLVAGIYGILVLLPGYFGERQIATRYPPAVTHPEYYYGFFGVALAWQIVFLVIAKDPARFRPIIPAAILEKLSYAAATTTLFALGRLATLFAIFGLVDLALGILFTTCYVQLGKSTTQTAHASQ